MCHLTSGGLYPKKNICTFSTMLKLLVTTIAMNNIAIFTSVATRLHTCGIMGEILGLGLNTVERLRFE